MLLLVWFREKEREEEILRALEMLLEVDSAALTLTETCILTVHGEFRWEAGPTEMWKPNEEELLLPPVSQQQRLTPFDGKFAWDAYRTQF